MEKESGVEIASRSESSCLHALLLEIALFAEDAAAHLQDGLEAFAADLGIFAESLHTGVFDLVLDLLPPTTKGGDFRFLVERGRGGRVERALLVGDGFANAEDV